MLRHEILCKVCCLVLFQCFCSHCFGPSSYCYITKEGLFLFFLCAFQSYDEHFLSNTFHTHITDSKFTNPQEHHNISTGNNFKDLSHNKELEPEVGCLVKRNRTEWGIGNKSRPKKLSWVYLCCQKTISRYQSVIKHWKGVIIWALFVCSW